MACNINANPPELDINGAGYAIWKKEIDLWCQITKVPAANRAITIYFSLKGKARKAAQQIPQDELRTNSGINILLEKLDKLIVPSEALRLFNAHNTLRNVVRKPEGLVHDYVTEFDHAKFLFEQEGLEKDDTVLGLDLLSQCQLSQDKNQLVMSNLTEVSYEAMKEKLLTIHYDELDKHNKFKKAGNSSTGYGEGNDSEEIFYARAQNYKRGRSSNYRGNSENGGRKRMRYSRGAGNGFGRQEYGSQPTYRSKNPTGSDGRPSRCNICQSVLHWYRDCPHAHEKNQNSENFSDRANKVHFSALVAFAGYAGKNETCKIKLLREETKGCGVVDSGCATTVCGVGWIEDFIANLCDEEKDNIEETPSSESFTFGDGSTVRSLKKVKIPCWINGNRGFLTTDVVECEIPLLLSKKTLKNLKMVLDFENDTIRCGNCVIPLVNTKSGHYALPLTL